jgi:hypothetical protein
MDAVGMTAVAVLNANLASGFGVAALQALTSSGPGQLVNMLV